MSTAPSMIGGSSKELRSKCCRGTATAAIPHNLYIFVSASWCGDESSLVFVKVAVCERCWQVNQ